MIKNIFLILIFLFFNNILFAQYSYLNIFEEGKEYYLIGDGVNIRDIPSTNGNIVEKLPIGKKIKILSKEPYKLTLRGFESNWYQIYFDNKSGYVWGGMIAFNTISSINNNKIKYHCGIYSIENLEDNNQRILLQVRISKNNKELGKLITDDDINFSYLNTSSLLVDVESIGNKGLLNVNDIILIKCIQEDKNDFHTSLILFWDKKNIYNVIGLSSYFNNQASLEEYLIYPNDSKGELNTIIYVSEKWGNNENGYFHDFIIKRFKWNKNGLIEFK